MFAGIALGADLAHAKVDSLTKLARGSYGIVFVEDDLMIGKGEDSQSTMVEIS
jgi:hypothetical protein